MLQDTLVVWSTEFGRTPFTEGLGARGRDHHQHAFNCWLASAGVRKGFSYGVSDEVGYYVGEDPVTNYDFHATILHLLGLDHKKLTFYHNGIQRRLTDVHGHVVRGVIGVTVRGESPASTETVPAPAGQGATQSAGMQGRSNAVTTFTTGW